MRFNTAIKNCAQVPRPLCNDRSAVGVCLTQVQGFWLPAPLLLQSEPTSVREVGGLQESPCAREHLCYPKMHFMVVVLVCTEPQVFYRCPALGCRINPIGTSVFPCCGATLPGQDVSVTQVAAFVGRGRDGQEALGELAKQVARALALCS